VRGLSGFGVGVATWITSTGVASVRVASTVLVTTDVSTTACGVGVTAGWQAIMIKATVIKNANMDIVVFPVNISPSLESIGWFPG
jgi:hypothetical protein